MTISLTPIDTGTNTWGDVLSRLNELIDVTANNTVTVGGNAAVGNSSIIGTFGANTINATTANVVNITSNNATIEGLNSNTANISVLIVDTLTANTFSAITTDTITANTGNFNNISADNFSANAFSIITANVQSLTSNTATIQSTLGINTTELRYRLTVGEPGTVDSTTFNSRMIGISGAGGAGYKLDDTSNNIKAVLGTFGNSYVQLMSQTSHDLVFGTNNLEAFRVSTNSNVGVGITNPLVKLQVNDKFAVGNQVTSTRISSDLSEARDFTVIGSNGGARIWRTSSTGDTVVEYALGTNSNITSVERWQTGINANGYFIRSYSSSTGTNRLNISKTGDVGIGTTNNPVSSAILELNSTSKGFLPTRMTTAQRNSISSPATGLLIYNTSQGRPQFYDGSGWRDATFSGNYNDLSNTPALGNSAALNVGTSAGTVAAGNDSRITGAVQRAGDSITGGFTGTSKNLGNLAGSVNITPVGGNIQHGNNNGNCTINAPTAGGTYTIIIEIVNTANAGTVTLNGFDKIDGMSFTTTNTHKFLVYITKTNTVVKASVEAMQ